MSEMKRNPKLLGMLGLASRARKIVTGTELVTEKIKSGKAVYYVVIASDVSQNTLKKLVNCCEYYEMEYKQSDFTQDEISHAVGKSCLVSSVAITDSNFADAIKNLL
jgi:ribosomal protein L7Ae-like RNA K-turn-binding protein